jgi:hypothetical protein
MNKKQKALTIVVLCAFVFFGVLTGRHGIAQNWPELLLVWFMLAIVYVGLFFVLKSSN